MTEVLPGFRAFVVRRFGDEGRSWLNELPVTLAELAQTWGLKLGEELLGGVLSCVVAAGPDAVVKIAGPWSDWRAEATALTAWGGRGAPRLLAVDEEHRALLVERIRPGTGAPEASARDVATLLAHLHLQPPPGLRSLAEVARERVERALLDERTTPYKAEWALSRLGELEREPPTPVLLHGDFDGRNLLACRLRGLAAIDPLPCSGDPAYDAGYWAHANGRPGRRARTTAIAQALELPVDRVRGWCAIVAIHG